MGSRKKAREWKRQRFQTDLSRDGSGFSYPPRFRAWQMPLGRGARKVILIGLLIQVAVAGFFAVVVIIEKILL